MAKDYFLDINEIKKRIPHRFPFLLIDRVISFEHGPDPAKRVGRKVVARKNVTANEFFFEGHFPDNPVMPGVLQIEAMAQAGALACAPEADGGVDVLFAKVSEGRFKKPVVPGDILEIHAEITNDKRGICAVDCKTYCEGEVVSEVSIMARVTARNNGGGQ